MTEVRPERVLLLSMPFGAVERPALSLGLLKAHCERAEVACDTRYFTFKFADRIGLGDYLWLCSEETPYTAFIGEWIFAEALYGTRPYADASYVDEILRRTWHMDDAAIARVERVRAQAEPFLEECLRETPWDDYTLVGFTSVFQQNLASLALAARLKRLHPDLTLCFGGANWEEVMGVTLQTQFPFVDLAFSGEADKSFPEVLQARREGRGVHGIHGVTSVASNGLAQSGDADRVREVDSLPTPNFSDFFDQLRCSLAGGALTPSLLMETSRGCWWGERSHCTFCGLNGATMAFRSKSPEKVIAEIKHLRTEHGARIFNMVDDILDQSYFRTVLPEIAKAKLDVEFFWEVKSNLSPEQVRTLRDAGVTSVQPGIESLNDHVLKLMKKGVTAFRNVELLKWCKEYGIKPYWNFLYGFPGETAQDYEAMVELIPAIWHLDAPTGYGPVRVDRFSPFHNEPAAYGMMNLRPMAPFTFLYPFGKKALQDIAYYFDFDYVEDRADDTYAKPAIELVRAWMADKARGGLELRQGPEGTVEIIDSRDGPNSEPTRARLSGWKAAVYLACDRTQPLSKLADVARGVPSDELEAFLARCVEHRLMLTNGQAWLNVAVHNPPREEPAGEATPDAPELATVDA